MAVVGGAWFGFFVLGFIVEVVLVGVVVVVVVIVVVVNGVEADFVVVVVGYSWKCLLHWPVHSIACQSLGTGSCIRPQENFKVGFLKHHFYTFAYVILELLLLFSIEMGLLHPSILYENQLFWTFLQLCSPF